MAKKPSLTAALQVASGQNKKETIKKFRQEQTIRPSRQDKKAIIGYFHPNVSKQLRQMALDEDTSIQDLLREALNDLFQKRGKASIA